MQVYLAAPIVNISSDTKIQISCIKNLLKAAEIDVYDPKENGTKNSWGVVLDEWARALFELDIAGISKSDWIVALDYGRNSTAGTAWECGYGFGIGKKILIIEMYEENEYSIMMRGCSANYCKFDEFTSTPFLDIKTKFFIERGRIQDNSGTILN